MTKKKPRPPAQTITVIRRRSRLAHRECGVCGEPIQPGETYATGSLALPRGRRFRAVLCGECVGAR